MIKQQFAAAAVAEHADGDSALAAIQAGLRPDIALLDLDMPGMVDLHALRGIHAAADDVPIMVISGSEKAADALAVLDAGAVGYAPKSAEPSILLAALQLCLKGGIYVPPLVLGALSDRQETPSPAASIPMNASSGALSTLTPRQWDVLRLLTDGSSNKVIARALELSEGTVKIHVAAILRALDVQNRAEAVNRAMRLGLT